MANRLQRSRLQQIIDRRAVLLPPYLDKIDPHQFGQVLFNAAHAARKPCGQRGLGAWFIRGLSLLGGEPFEPSNQQALLPLLRKVRKAYPEKTIWCYTGYDFEQDLLTGRLCDWPVTEELLSYIDVLVDGEFKLDLKNPNLRFRGSSNQRVIDLKKSLYGDELVLWSEAY